MYEYEIRNGIGKEDQMALRGIGRETVQYMNDEFRPNPLFLFSRESQVRKVRRIPVNNNSRRCRESYSSSQGRTGPCPISIQE